MVSPGLYELFSHVPLFISQKIPLSFHSFIPIVRKKYISCALDALIILK